MDREDLRDIQEEFDREALLWDLLRRLDASKDDTDANLSGKQLLKVYPDLPLRLGERLAETRRVLEDTKISFGKY